MSENKVNISDLNKSPQNMAEYYKAELMKMYKKSCEDNSKKIITPIVKNEVIPEVHKEEPKEPEIIVPIISENSQIEEEEKVDPPIINNNIYEREEISSDVPVETNYGYLSVEVFSGCFPAPLCNAHISVLSFEKPRSVFKFLTTKKNGETPSVKLPVEITSNKNKTDKRSFSKYTVRVCADGYKTKEIDVTIYSGIKSIVEFKLEPVF